jgi:hypothetical protein
MVLNAAQNGKGISLTPSACRQVANTLVEQSQAGQQLLDILIPTDNLLKAYVNEYGDGLMKELLGHDDVVEGEILDEDEDEIRFDSEVAGLDASEEE